MKVGLIGCGHIASTHARAVRAAKDAEIVGVADKFVDYARAFAEQHGVRYVYESAEQLVDELNPDVVHILTPPETHYATALLCLEKGVHVLVEKPLALERGQCRELIDAAKRNNVMLSVDHNYQFEPVIQKARSILSTGKLGKLVTIEVDYGFDVNRYPAILHPGAPKSHWMYRLNGGPLEDQIAHPLSLISRHVDKVHDVIVHQRNRGVLPEPWGDEIRVIFDAEPIHAEIYISFGIRPDAMVLTMRCTEGTISADLFSMTVNVDARGALPRGAARGSLPFRRSWRAMKQGLGNVFSLAFGRLDKTAGVATVVKGFYRAIQMGESAPVRMEEGYDVVDLIQRIWPEPFKVSAESDSVPVRAPTETSVANVLVTGASGFIGSHLVKRLADEGELVRVFVRPGSPGVGLLMDLPIEVVYGDLANPEAVRQAMHGIDMVYHVGGAMSDDWETHKRSTVQGTQHMVDAAVAEGVKRFVYFSSLVVYDLRGVRDGTPIDEDHPHDASGRLGPYSRGKVEAERIVSAAHQQEGLPTTIIRPGMVIGPRGRVFFPHLGYRLGDKVFIVLGRGDVLLPLVHIDNLLDGVIRAGHSDRAVGSVYHFVDDGDVTVNDYLNHFLQIATTPAQIVHVPYFLPYCATAAYEVCAALGLVKRGVTSRAQLAWKHRSVRVRNERAKVDLGWAASVPIDQGIKSVFRWYVETCK